MHRFRLPPLAASTASALEEVQYQLASGPPAGAALLDAGDRPLTLPELRAIQQRLRDAGLDLHQVDACDPLPLVPAAVLGLNTTLQEPPSSSERSLSGSTADPSALSIHRGTLRSGDHLQVEGSLLVLGDVNPGAKVSAGGDVCVWGRLRGVAHAGCRGNGDARIVALQLRPLQLRIAGAVARGPEDVPPAGFCEEAVLVDGGIAIRPADPGWKSALVG